MSLRDGGSARYRRSSLAPGASHERRASLLAGYADGAGLVARISLGRDCRGRADVVEEAVSALGAAGDADLAAVEDQAEGEAAPFLRGEEGAELVLDLDRVVLGRQAEHAADAGDVGVVRE